MPTLPTDAELVRRIRLRDESAWTICLSRYTGRLQAFVFSRLGNIASAEDVVQETFLGFLTALPNYDDATPLESFLFAIAAHKMTDVLRKQGRRPALSVSLAHDSGPADFVGPGRMASSLARSREQRGREADMLAASLRSLVQQWTSRGEFTRLKCAELLFVQGLPNKDVARALQISEQEVANHKQFVLQKLKAAAPEAFVPEEF